MAFIHKIGNIIIRFLLAAIVLYLLNSIATVVDFHIPINPLTVLVTGILGLPGLISLICIKLFII